MGFRVAILVVLIALAGCTTEVGPNSLVDGWSIGEGDPCGVEVEPCVAYVAVATERLASRDPFHAPIVEVTVHEEGLYPNQDGELGPIFRSGGSTTIVLFQLADRSHRAIGVRYILNDELPSADDHGPERRSGRGGDGAPASTP